MTKAGNISIDIDRIKEELERVFKLHHGNIKTYSDEMLMNATNQVADLFRMINDSIILDNNGPRKLNDLEVFVTLYEFCANREVINQSTSHNLIGVLSSNAGVCEGFTELLECLCNYVGIPFLFKAVDYVNDNNQAIGGHACCEVIVNDKDGNKHCLYCDPMLDAPDNKYDDFHYNGLLLQDDDVNKYVYRQVPQKGSIFNFYNNFSSEIAFSNSIKDLKEVDPFLQNYANLLGDDIVKTGALKKNLIEMNKFFRLNVNYQELNDNQLLYAYQQMFENYKSMAKPFECDELVEAIKNAKAAELVYKDHMNYNEAISESESIFDSRMSRSIQLHNMYWSGDGTSFIFTELEQKKIK